MKEENEKQKVCYTNLSTPLKVFVVEGWIVIGFYMLAFATGVVLSVLGQ